MKGVILAGGTGSRLRPLTLTTNKHLLPVHDRPMIHYPIRSLVDAGIGDVLIVTGGEYVGEFQRVLGDGAALGLARLTFAAQRGAGGIADALRQAESFAVGEKLCVILGDNIIGGTIKGPAERFVAQKSGARVLLKAVSDARRYGVAELDARGRIKRILEKPDHPPSDLAVVGIYFYDADVFDVIRTLKPSARGELEITGVNNAYVARGTLEHEMLDGWWTDAGTHESLAEAARLARGS
ncbi:MAG: NTP transferase domain-containing protein [Planctomycetes bacterium]|nr:NTP transferase domain-containing protein [Planctomycetota bacterium]